MLPHLLKPYAKDSLGIDHENFNKRLSRMRKSVECSFGIPYAKWRLLSKYNETEVNLSEKIIRCICVLHNIIIDREGMGYNLIKTEVVFVADSKKKSLGRPTNEAKSVRELFTVYFANNSLIYNKEITK